MALSVRFSCFSKKHRLHEKRTQHCDVNLPFRRGSNDSNQMKSQSFDRAPRALSVYVGLRFWSPQWANRGGVY